MIFNDYCWDNDLVLSFVFDLLPSCIFFIDIIVQYVQDCMCSSEASWTVYVIVYQLKYIFMLDFSCGWIQTIFQKRVKKILVNVLSYILSQIVLVRWFKLVYFLNNFCAVWKMVKQDGQIHLCSIMFSHSNVAVN